MDQALPDSLVLLSGVVFYGFLCAVYLIRARGADRLELALAPAFSVLLTPFAVLWLVNLSNGAGMARMVVLMPVVVYLVYDLWYRLLTRKKPVHHPKKWPPGLVVYLLLMQAGAFGLNWYGYLVSKMHGQVLVACYFMMLGCFGFYQGMHTKRRTADIGKH